MLGWMQMWTNQRIFIHFPKMVSLGLGHNFLNIYPFLMKMVPIESWEWELSIGTIFIKNGSILRKLWTHPNDNIFGGIHVYPYFLGKCVQTTEILEISYFVFSLNSTDLPPNILILDFLQVKFFKEKKNVLIDSRANR